MRIEPISKLSLPNFTTEQEMTDYLGVSGVLADGHGPLSIEYKTNGLEKDQQIEPERKVAKVIEVVAEFVGSVLH